MARTLFDKIWDPHVVADLGGGWSLLHIDRVLLHDLSGARALNEIKEAGYPLAHPELVFATPDHAVSSAPGRTSETFAGGARLVAGLRQRAAETGVRLFDLGEDGQGIVHVMGPELGVVLPGTTLVCGDSHTCTNGGMGAYAFGIGASELKHVLATQCLPQRKPKRLRIRYEGTLPQGVSPKDMILHAIGRFGAAAGTGHAVEYAGAAVRALSVEGRLTLCNLSIEMGARAGMVAADDTTFEWLAGRRFAPKGAAWDAALAHWRGLPTDAGASFDRDLLIDAADIAPQITWGTSPEHVLPVGGVIPDPSDAPDAARRAAWTAALDYMDLRPGAPIAGTKVDWVFIGSCTNSRIEDLRAAAGILRGRHVAPHVTAWVVPGSERVKRDAEAEGLDALFRASGFEWREPGCALCVAANGEAVPPGARCVSTSNRNFVGRQGPGARTHLASPAMAAAAAVTGAITDVRRMEAA
ncbi:3-isopropylmalate dehydratase large subunit [Roseomonas hellenica]|uniref:3-isopropylmalate dehydratase n=1 Tax=Plastoroseomonas hellenica TaxID=2687306 RepID=A0ABS5F6P0_9PROT|nr:3-isopropylmalate dehydratase large subunit [Plastoroseomonas hellenica]MBR0668108.1 3-isopropylmalate dehydratase large subunit [Plastoroseomonas hellenica]